MYFLIQLSFNQQCLVFYWITIFPLTIKYSYLNKFLIDDQLKYLKDSKYSSMLKYQYFIVILLNWIIHGDVPNNHIKIYLLELSLLDSILVTNKVWINPFVVYWVLFCNSLLQMY